MRTNIEIDDELLSQAMVAAGLPTKRATVEEGLRLLVRVRKQTEALEDLKGLGWEGNLDEMRQDRLPGPAMILVDTSVWIAHLRGDRNQAAAKLEVAARREPLLIGDLILLEVLQGARNEAHALRIERGLRSTPSRRCWTLNWPSKPPATIANCANWALRSARPPISSSGPSASNTVIPCSTMTATSRPWNGIWALWSCEPASS